MMNVEYFAKKIERTQRERDEFVHTANQQVAAYNGAIQAYEQIINELIQEQQTADEPGKDVFKE